MHNQFINFGDEKMSKSLGNVMTARKFLEDYHGEILKFMFLTVHYRSMLSFSKRLWMFSVAMVEFQVLSK